MDASFVKAAKALAADFLFSAGFGVARRSAATLAGFAGLAMAFGLSAGAGNSLNTAKKADLIRTECLDTPLDSRTVWRDCNPAIHPVLAQGRKLVISVK